MALSEFIPNLNKLEKQPHWATQPLPQGRAVGLKQFQVEDATREDVSTGTRKFMVSLWYPAVPDATASQARLADILAPNFWDAVVRLTEGGTAKDEAFLVLDLGRLSVRAQRGLSVLKGESRPVLIYYPGGQSHRMSNAGLCEQLAARGYAVLALDAPRDAPLVVFPDGQIVTQPLGDENYIWPRVADVQFLLDALPELSKTMFGGDLDLDRIGMFGHSRGGYLSTICSVQDPRIQAAINMDGFPWGLWVNEGTGLDQFPEEFQRAAKSRRTPLLRLLGDQGDPEMARAVFEREASETSGDFLLAAIHGWKHTDFGQTGFLSGDIKALYKQSFTPAPADRAALLLDTVADFFDTYLHGTAARPRLAETQNPAWDVFFQPGRHR